MQKSTFSVNFFIRRTRLGKSGETPIMMRISVDGRYTELSTQRRVPVEQWSQSRCCATGKTAVASEVNRHFDNLRSKASEAHQNFLAKDGYVDPYIIKEFLLGKHRRQRFFFEVFEEHNARIASLVGKDYDRTTYHRYMLCLRYFREMMARQTKAEDFPIRNLSHEMVRDFEHFLKTKKRVAQNTMIRYMKCLKKVVNLSLANGWMTVNPFAGIKYAEKKVIREYLTMPEVNRLREKEFSIQRLEWCEIYSCSAPTRGWRISMFTTSAPRISPRMHTAASGYANNARRPMWSSMCPCSNIRCRYSKSTRITHYARSGARFCPSMPTRR